MSVIKYLAAGAALAMFCTLGVVHPAAAQTGSAAGKTQRQLDIAAARADRKAIVGANMNLSEAQAKAFWPLYEQYQKELHQINDRTAMLLVGYSNAYGTSNLTDQKAKALLENYFEIEEAEIKLKRSFVPKLSNVLPGVKVARYMQLENKIRAIVKYELAREVPLAQ